ncbi:MAG: lytic transglycosylase domain-containing protein [Anaerolineales bacterium]
MTRERDSLLHNPAGETVTFRVDRVIVLSLLIFFVMIAVHAIGILSPAFHAAYTRTPALHSSAAVAPQEQQSHEPVFHSEYFSPQVVRWEGSIFDWADQSGLPPDLIAIVMQIESCGDRYARSSAGAMGIFQVMPFHFGSQEDPFDPQVNASRGLDYLAHGYASSEQDIRLTLAGYNGGHSIMNAPPKLWPEETQRYVLWGVGIWEDIQFGRHPSPTLERWLHAGGASLCSAAAASTLLTSSSN